MYISNNDDGDGDGRRYSNNDSNSCYIDYYKIMISRKKNNDITVIVMMIQHNIFDNKLWLNTTAIITFTSYLIDFKINIFF